MNCFLICNLIVVMALGNTWFTSRSTVCIHASVIPYILHLLKYREECFLALQQLPTMYVK